MTRSWRFEDLDAWERETGHSRSVLAELLVQAPFHGTEREFQVWAAYRDQMRAALAFPPAGFPAPTLRREIESHMQRLDDSARSPSFLGPDARNGTDENP